MNENPIEIRVEAYASSLSQHCYMLLQGASSGYGGEC